MAMSAKFYEMIFVILRYTDEKKRLLEWIEAKWFLFQIVSLVLICTLNNY